MSRTCQSCRIQSKTHMQKISNRLKRIFKDLVVKIEVLNQNRTFLFNLIIVFQLKSGYICRYCLSNVESFQRFREKVSAIHDVFKPFIEKLAEKEKPKTLRLSDVAVNPESISTECKQINQNSAYREVNKSSCIQLLRTKVNPPMLPPRRVAFPAITKVTSAAKFVPLVKVVKPVNSAGIKIIYRTPIDAHVVDPLKAEEEKPRKSVEVRNLQNDPLKIEVDKEPVIKEVQVESVIDSANINQFSDSESDEGNLVIDEDAEDDNVKNYDSSTPKFSVELAQQPVQTNQAVLVKRVAKKNEWSLPVFIPKPGSFISNPAKFVLKPKHVTIPDNSAPKSDVSSSKSEEYFNALKTVCLKKDLLKSLQSKWRPKFARQITPPSFEPILHRFETKVVKVRESRTILTPLTKSTEKSMHCDLCDFFTEDRDLFVRHFNTWHVEAAPEEFFTCKYCNRRFRLEYRLVIHTNKWHPEAVKFKCGDCFASFITEEFLQKHRKKDVCHKFKSRNFPANATFTPRDKVICDLCGKMVFNLNTHINQVHEKKRDHLCRVKSIDHFITSSQIFLFTVVRKSFFLEINAYTTRTGLSHRRRHQTLRM